MIYDFSWFCGLAGWFLSWFPQGSLMQLYLVEGWLTWLAVGADCCLGLHRSAPHGLFSFSKLDQLLWLPLQSQGSSPRGPEWKLQGLLRYSLESWIMSFPQTSVGQSKSQGQPRLQRWWKTLGFPLLYGRTAKWLCKGPWLPRWEEFMVKFFRVINF